MAFRPPRSRTWRSCRCGGSRTISSTSRPSGRSAQRAGRAAALHTPPRSATCAPAAIAGARVNGTRAHKRAVSTRVDGRVARAKACDPAIGIGQSPRTPRRLSRHCDCTGPAARWGGPARQRPQAQTLALLSLRRQTPLYGQPWMKPLTDDEVVKLLPGLAEAARADANIAKRFVAPRTGLSEGGRQRLVLGSGGVARDYLSLTAKALRIANERASNPSRPHNRISAEDVNGAAADLSAQKQDDLRLDAGRDADKLRARLGLPGSNGTRTYAKRGHRARVAGAPVSPSCPWGA